MKKNSKKVDKKVYTNIWDCIKKFLKQKQTNEFTHHAFKLTILHKNGARAAPLLSDNCNNEERAPGEESHNQNQQLHILWRDFTSKYLNLKGIPGKDTSWTENTDNMHRFPFWHVSHGLFF